MPRQSADGVQKVRKPEIDRRVGLIPKTANRQTQTAPILDSTPIFKHRSLRVWLIGTAIYFLFYRFMIVWYLGFHATGELNRPLKFNSRGFHYGVLAISAVLLAASGFFFYLTNPWLALVVIPLVWFSFAIRNGREQRRLNGIVSRAVEIQVRMEREGASQDAINRAVYLGATGQVWGPKDPVDMELKSFLKYCVLSELMGFDTSLEFQKTLENRNYISMNDKIDARVDHYHNALSRFKS
jgi:hypothetical protein